MSRMSAIFKNPWDFLLKKYPPVNSGGALVPPHFIDINRGGRGNWQGDEKVTSFFVGWKVEGHKYLGKTNRKTT